MPVNPASYDGLCLRFVTGAYAIVGVGLHSAPSAVPYWAHHASAQRPEDTNPPAGSSVF
jgi:hypothetical protein